MKSQYDNINLRVLSQTNNEAEKETPLCTILSFVAVFLFFILGFCLLGTSIANELSDFWGDLVQGFVPDLLWYFDESEGCW